MYDVASAAAASTVERASSLASSLPSVQLPTLSWDSGSGSGGGGGGRGGGADAEASSGLIPMPISISWGGSTATADGQSGTEDRVSEADWGIAGAPCGLCASLSFKERITGFLLCSGIGIFLELAAFGSWSAMMTGQMQRFVIPYTFGNVFNLGATLFLVGPYRQCTAMWKPVRRAAAALYLICMFLTLVCVWIRWRDYNLHFLGALLTFLCVSLQSAAIFWYALSYVPYGRALFARWARWLRGWFTE